jgi:hypothetical protein
MNPILVRIAHGRETLSRLWVLQSLALSDVAHGSQFSMTSPLNYEGQFMLVKLR